MKLKSLLAVVAMAVAPAAMADISLTVLGGLNFHNPDIGNVETSPEAKFSYGALVGFGTPWAFSAETGLLHVEKEFTMSVLGLGARVDSSAWEIPLLLRYNFADFFTVGAGGFYQFPEMGDFVELGDNDFGLKGSARLGFQIVPAARFILEGQYNYGLKDLNEGPGKYKNRELLTFAGVMFGF